ncbi:macrolide export ATP-binding/permease protein MacB [Muribaculaceae bacterium]|jgi:putative ABC transport system permease protein|nr:macrolide export ATP-binding/permease protein MacB [Muribaculaceae bacterium]
MFDLAREIWQTISNNKLRTSLTGVAVAWGIFMLIVLVGMTKGVINSFEEEVGSQGSNVLQVWGGQTTEPWHGYRQGRQINLKTRDIDAVGNSHNAKISDVSSVIYCTGVISTSEDYISSGFSGVYPSQLRRSGNKMESGRFINQSDLAERRKVMVLSEKNVELLFPGKKNQEVIGRKVEALGLAFTVVGVYGTQWNRTSYIPFTTAVMCQANSDDVGSIVVEMRDVETEADGKAVEESVRTVLAAQHHFKADDSGAVWISNRFLQFITMQQGMGILNATMWIIGLFTLLSGIVGVSNIMFVSVRERTHEIGVRRAIGAKPRNVLVQIVMESVAITALFGYIGILMGIGATELLAAAFDGQDFISNPRVDISLAVNVTVVLVVAGCVAGLFPALKALKIKPVEALRDE